MRNPDFLTKTNVSSQLLKSLCALLVKIMMGFYSITEENVSISSQRAAAKQFQASLLQEGEIPQAIPEGSTA